MRKPQKPISEKRLRKMALKFCKKERKSGMFATDTVFDFLSYVSEHKNDKL